MARVGFARGLKRNGVAVSEAEKDFAQTAFKALSDLGLADLNWLKEDPHCA